MRKILLLLFCFPAVVMAQDSSKTYMSISTEMIFSFAKIDDHGNSEGNNMRWSPVFNPQWMLNRDLSSKFGLFTGFAVRNVGFIYEDPHDSLNNTKTKFRTYNVGIPVGLKIGNINKVLLFGGYEIEFPISYKQKTFINEDKEDKDVIWFSERVEPVQHSVLLGFQFKHGATIKFKYYFSEFFNRDHTELINGFETKPYDVGVNIFYFSLSWNVFTNYKDVLD